MLKNGTNLKGISVIFMPTSISRQYFFLETLLALVTYMHTKRSRRYSMTCIRTVGYSYNLRVKEKSERTAEARERQSYDLKAERYNNEEEKETITKGKIHFKI